MKKQELTDIQKKILEVLKKYIQKNSIPPTIKELCGLCGLTSSSSVHHQLLRLEKKGYIARDKTKSRSIRINSPKKSSTKNKLIEYLDIMDNTPEENISNIAKGKENSNFRHEETPELLEKEVLIEECLPEYDFMQEHIQEKEEKEARDKIKNELEKEEKEARDRIKSELEKEEKEARDRIKSELKKEEKEARDKIKSELEKEERISEEEQDKCGEEERISEEEQDKCGEEERISEEEQDKYGEEERISEEEQDLTEYSFAAFNQNLEATQKDAYKLPSDFIGTSEAFIVEIQDDSMADYGIYQKDLAVIEYNDAPSNGSIVFAIVNHKAILRSINRVNTFISLSAGRDSQPLKTDINNINIIGTLKFIFRTQYSNEPEGNAIYPLISFNGNVYNTENAYSLPVRLIGVRNAFLYRMTDDSMADYDLFKDDIAIIENTEDPNGDEVVLAIYDNEIIVRILKKTENYVELHAGSKHIKPLKTTRESLVFLGVLKGLLRKINV